MVEMENKFQIKPFAAKKSLRNTSALFAADEMSDDNTREADAATAGYSRKSRRMEGLLRLLSDLSLVRVQPLSCE